MYPAPALQNSLEEKIDIKQIILQINVQKYNLKKCYEGEVPCAAWEMRSEKTPPEEATTELRATH